MQLGHNQLPDGLHGPPDSLFEEYTQAALEFLLANRVIRYGQERRGESVPDGLAFTWSDTTILYDAKAYRNGYQVTRESVRQFSDYVEDFHRRYERYTGRVYAVLLISGKFSSGEDSLENQSRALYAKCNTPFRYMTADGLGAAAGLLAEYPSLRTVLDWRRIFSFTEVTPAVIKSAVEAALKDKIVR